MKKNMKKTWNKPTITQLGVSKTYNVNKKNHNEARWGNKNHADPHQS